MSTEDQAKNGFKTFVTTLVVSLVVFGGAYHFLTNLSPSSSLDAENFESRSSGSLAYTPNSGDVEGVNTGSSVFDVINSTEVAASAPAVLAGEDTTETTETTVPETGSETLIGTVVGMSALALATYLVFVGPRNLALKTFEKDASK